MANIDSYLEQIRSAVYGEEVRGSIHDAISAINQDCHSYGEGVVENVNNIVAECEQEISNFTQEVQSSIDDCKDWTLKKIESVSGITITESIYVESKQHYRWEILRGQYHLISASSRYLSMAVPVEAGSVYRIVARRSDETLSNSVPFIAAAWDMGNTDGPFGIGGEPTFLISEADEHFILVPDGNCTHVLVNSYLIAPAIQKVKKPISDLLLKSQTQSGGLNLLWSGILVGDTGDGIEVEFTIPEQCFFNTGKELILAVNGYYSREDQLAYDLYTTGLCFGDPNELGLAEGQWAPYRYGNFMRRGSRTDSWQSSSQTLALDIEVNKVADSRYATCVVTNRSPNFYMTSVSAMIAQ